MRLILVRHAQVDPRADVAPHEWQLSERGRRDAEALARWPGWNGVTVVASSSEPKAVETATPIAAAAGVELPVEDDLREVRRGSELLSHEAHVARVSAYLEGASVRGWEPWEQARRRITACIDRLVADAVGDVAVISHGVVLSVFLGLSAQEWERIPFPAIAVLQGSGLAIRQPFVGLQDPTP